MRNVKTENQSDAEGDSFLLSDKNPVGPLHWMHVRKCATALAGLVIASQELECVVRGCAGCGGIELNSIVRHGRLGHSVKCQLQQADFRMIHVASAVGAFVHIATGPKPGEFRAAHGEFADQFGEDPIIGVSAALHAQASDMSAREVFPVDFLCPRVGVEEEHSSRRWAPEDVVRCVRLEVVSGEPVTKIVPRENVVTSSKDQGRHLRHSGQEIPHGSRSVLCSRVVPLRPHSLGVEIE